MNGPSSHAAERLLAEHQWLTRLAKGLVANTEDASDLAQDTIVAALIHPPDDDRPVRPWLARIAKNLSARQALSRDRRVARELYFSRREHTSPTADVVARVSLQRSIVEAVLALDEPYCSTILLRYWDGLSPRRIAARTNIPVQTVRTRLKRGLAQLRESLDRRHQGREVWLGALVPIAHGWPVASTSIESVTVLKSGVLAMSLMGKASVAALLMAALVWTWIEMVPLDDPPREPIGSVQQTEPPLEQQTVSSESTAASDRVSIESGASVPVPQSPPAVRPLALASECIAATESFDEQLVCVSALNLREVGAEEIGQWVCAQSMPYRSIMIVMQVRVSQLEPAEVLPFIEKFQQTCEKYAETSLTVACLGYGKYLSESWYWNVAQCVNLASMLPEAGSDAAIQLAESFVSEGDAPVTNLIQDIGTGASGGSVDQVYRAALISVVHLRDPLERLTYMDRVYRTASGDYGKLASIFTTFLTNGQSWVDGVSTPSLQLLNKVLHDPRFASYCAVQLGVMDRTVAPEDQALWASIWDYAKQLREQD